VREWDSAGVNRGSGGLGAGLWGIGGERKEKTPHKAAGCGKAQQQRSFMQHLHKTRDQSVSPRAHGIHDTPKTSVTTDPRVQIDWKEVLRRV
jgi:hypothetical protein